MAIDLDHLPGLLGWHGLTQGTPRPYTHSLATPVALIAVGALLGGRAKPIAFGAAFGVCAHLFRDLCTGPGLALAWPLSGAVVRLPYLAFAAGLILTAVAIIAATARRRSSWERRPAKGQSALLSRLLPCLLAAALTAWLAVTPARGDCLPDRVRGLYPEGRPAPRAHQLVREASRAGTGDPQLVQAMAHASDRSLSAAGGVGTRRPPARHLGAVDALGPRLLSARDRQRPI